MDRLEHRLLAQVGRASADYGLLEAGDRVMVAVSGGKDSHALLYLLRELQKKAPFEFSIIAVNVDQGHPGFPKRVLPDYFEAQGKRVPGDRGGHVLRRAGEDAAR
jgi:tRNA 2-thiocytidine biosynthesis protein TtcA